MSFFGLKETSFRWLFAELVVLILGILIAFQIDQWNTSRLERQSEYSVLTLIHSELEDDFQQNVRKLEVWEGQLESAIDLREQLLSDSAPNEAQLVQSFHRALITARTVNVSGSFNALQDNGELSLISDTSLLAELDNYYNERIPYLSEIAESLVRQREEFQLSAMPDLYLDVENSTTLTIVTKIGVPISNIPSNEKFLPLLGNLALALSVNIQRVSDTNDDIISLMDSVRKHQDGL